MKDPKIKLYDTLQHKESGLIGVYVEHVNFGEGYMVQVEDDKGRRIICGGYDDLEKVATD